MIIVQIGILYICLLVGSCYVLLLRVTVLKSEFVELKLIKTKKQYDAYLDWVDAMFDKKVKSNTPDGNKVEVALLLIKQYEDANYPIPMPDPIDAIRIRMDEIGLKNKDLVGKFGSKGYVSALLNKKKPLTLELAKLFHQELNIPAEVLLS